MYGSDGAQMEGNNAEAARLAVANNLNVKWIIDDKDLDTIISALSLGGDTRLYFLLKNVRDTNNLENKFDVAECDI